MGWNGSDISNAGNKSPVSIKPKKANPPARSGVRRGVLAGLIVVCIAGAVVWIIFGRNGGMRVSGKGAERKVQHPVAPAKPSTPKKAERSPMPADAVQAVENAPTARVTNVRQTVQMRTLPDGTKVPANRPYFTNHVERALSTLCNPGGMAIPLSSALRRFPESEILRILKAPMEYDKNDSEFILTRKMEMQRIKAEILGYMEDGHSLSEALAEADRTIRRDSSYLMMTRKSMQEALATGDGELIRAYAKTLNAKLEEKGMKPFEIPQQFRLDEKSPNEEDGTSNNENQESNYE